MQIEEKVFFVGLMRSGHHAVLNWFARNHVEPILHYNDCRIESGELRPHTPGLVLYYNGPTVKYVVEGSKSRAENLLENHYPGWARNHLVETLDANNRRALEECRTAIYSFEERDSRYIAEAVKISGPEKIITVVRDPMNFVASCLRHTEKYPETRPKIIGRMRERLEIWSDHVELLRRGPDEHHSAINYNYWFSSKEYRDAIATRYVFVNHDIGLDEILLFGKGSSFDDMRHEETASKMDVLNRWKAYKNDDEFRRIISDHLIGLAQDLFDIEYT